MMVFPTNSSESRLFDIYSKNLSFVKKYGHLDPDLDDIFVCPICFSIFPRSALSKRDNQEALITIEHLPPKSLGGKPSTLTCKKCNNQAGSELDNYLLNSLLFLDYLEKKPGATIDAQINVDDIQIAAQLESLGGDNYRLSYPGDRSNPQDFQEFIDRYRNSNISSMKISSSGAYRKPTKINRPDWSLLRIAYLMAFSVFGYSFIMTDINLKSIVAQFRNPNQDILKYWSYEGNFNISDDFLGVNLVIEPSELQSFLIVFDLITPYSKRRHGILLPGPTDPGIQIYEVLEKAPERKSEISIKHIPQDINFITNPEFCLASNMLWGNLKR